jgi:pimeloyl-ACP methyl ester carboxylesterase
VATFIVPGLATERCSVKLALTELALLPWQGIQLAARRFRASSAGALSGRAALFIHGWEGEQDANDAHWAARLAREGLDCATFDLGGHGLSGGARTEFRLCDYLRQTQAVYDWFVASLPAPPPGIGVCGSSLGAYLAIRLSAMRPVAALSLRVPANYPDEVMNGPPLAAYVVSGAARAWRSEPLLPARNGALDALRSFRGAVQIIAAEQDETIPVQTVTNYLAVVDAARLEFHELAGATHVLYEKSGPRHAAYQLVRHFLALNI